MTAEMGARLSEHRGKFFAGGWLWYVGGILVLAAGFNAVNGVQEIQTGAATIVQVLSMTVVTLVIGLLLLAMPMLRWRQTATCHENGIVWKRLIGTKTIARGELEGVQLIFHRGRYGNYDEVELKTRSGYVSIKGIADAEQLANHVRAWLSGPVGGASAPSAPSGGGWSPPGQSGGGWSPPG